MWELFQILSVRNFVIYPFIIEGERKRKLKKLLPFFLQISLFLFRFKLKALALAYLEQIQEG